MSDTITLYKDEGGEYRWTRQAANGDIIGAATEGYKDKDSARANIDRTQGGEFSIDDVTVHEE